MLGRKYRVESFLSEPSAKKRWAEGSTRFPVLGLLCRVHIIFQAKDARQISDSCLETSAPEGVWQGFVPGTAIWTAKVASTSYIILRVYNFFNYTPRACHICTVLSELAEAINRPSGDQATGTWHEN